MNQAEEQNVPLNSLGNRIQRDVGQDWDIQEYCLNYGH